MRSEYINKDDLKVGDVVGRKIPTMIGWGHFRYPKTIPTKIARITPARTKFVTEDGLEFKKSDILYHITEENQKQTHVARCATEIQRKLGVLDGLRSTAGLNSVDDETIIEICKRLCDIAELYTQAKDNGNKPK